LDDGIGRLKCKENGVERRLKEVIDDEEKKNKMIGRYGKKEEFEMMNSR
jgi:hypothetical protein